MSNDAVVWMVAFFCLVAVLWLDGGKDKHE